MRAGVSRRGVMKRDRLFLVSEPPELLEEWKTGMVWGHLGEEPPFSVVCGQTTDVTGTIWPLVWHFYRDSGWSVTGELPDITVTPSIRFSSLDGSSEWHGWIREGFVISD